MKKNLKRTLAKVMAVALTVSLVSVAPDADAAKKPKLAKKSVAVTKGKSKKVKIKNVKAKKVKKLTVKVKNKKIATVKKSGKTAVKVTGKKKGSTKATVSVTLKGKKKATKLTLKIKVNNAKGSTSKTPSTSTTPGGSTTPATQTPSQAPATQKPSQAPASEKPSTAPTVAPNEFGVSDPYKVTISEENESYADSNVKRVANGLETDGYNKDATFGADGSVTFTSVDAYNSGATFYISGEVETSTNDEGATVYTAKKVDLTQYKEVRFKVKDAYCETSLKILADGSNWWSKIEKWEGQDNITEGDRTVTYDLTSIDPASLKEVDSIGIAWHNEVGFTATLESIELVGKQAPVEPTAAPSTEPSTAPSAAPSQTPGNESGSVESGSTESGDVTKPTQAPDVESGDTTEPVVYKFTENNTIDVLDKNFGGVKTLNLPKKVTVKSTDTVSVKIKVTNEDGSDAAKANIQADIAADPNDAWNSRLFTSGQNPDDSTQWLWAKSGTELTLFKNMKYTKDNEDIKAFLADTTGTKTIDLCAICLQAANAQGTDDTKNLTITLESITVTPAKK